MSSLAGKWKSEKYGEVLHFVFNNDNTFTTDFPIDGSNKNGVYSLNGSNLTLTTNSMHVTVSAIIDGSNLAITYPTGHSINCRRV